MKKFLLLLAAAVATTGPGFAQAPAARPMPVRAAARPSPTELAQRGTRYLTQELGLSADQQTRLQPILLAQNQELLAVREKALTGRAKPGPGTDPKAILDKYDARIKGVLTPGQYTKYSQLQAEKRNNMLKRLPKGVGLGAPVAR